MQLSNLDLNLLRVLDAVLQEASITRAAQRLQLSQPAVSQAMGKLRRHFGDDLLRRSGNRYELTPLALQLREQTLAAMRSLERVFGSRPTFDPATERREFTLLCSDYGIALLGTALADLSTRAPSVVLRLTHHTPTDVVGATEAVRTVDGLVVPTGFVTGLPSSELFADDWVCLVAASNTKVGTALTMDDLATLPWAFTYYEPTAFTPPAKQLQLLGVEPRVEMVVASFVALPFVIAGTDRIALIQSRLAGLLIRDPAVRVLPCPFEAMPITEAMWWHPLQENDPAHTWLRQELLAACASPRLPPRWTFGISSTDDGYSQIPLPT